MLLDAFMTRKQLEARGRPLRAPVHRLNVPARIGVGLLLLVEVGCVLLAGSAHASAALGAAVAGLVLAHVGIYRVESRPASLKPRWRRPAAPSA